MGFRTIALSSDGSKEALARSLGADEFIDGSKVDQAKALQKFGGMKVIMSTAPNAGATESLINALAVDGTLLVLAVEPEPMRIPPREFSCPSRWQGRDLTDATPCSLAPHQAPLHQRLAGGFPEGRRGLLCVRAGEEDQVLGGALPVEQGAGGL